MEILIEGMEFYAFHGVYPEENRIGTRYTVDLSMSVPDDCGVNDDLSATVNYEDVYKTVECEMHHNSKLIEHLASRILDNIMHSFPSVLHSVITLYKYNPPLGGKVQRVGIRLER
ncbi:MAG: dihydroneopterin aldolase [Paludibacteraceae bacterium]|nr:dihydroneopterin aldolase [Paludibacteraceae bacterium]